MKEKILALIENVKNIFAARKKNMGSLTAHKPFIAELAQEESSLDSAKDIIQNLDETKPTFAASGLFYVIEKVVPVLRRWQARLQNIPASHTDVSGHQKATREFLTMKKEMFELIAALNVAAQPALMPTVDEADQVKSIIKMFESNKEKYVSEHPIQEVTQKNSYSNCGMQ